MTEARRHPFFKTKTKHTSILPRYQRRCAWGALTGRNEGEGRTRELSWFYSQYQSGGRHWPSMWRLSTCWALHLHVTPFRPSGLARVREAIPFSPFASLIEPLAMCLCKTQYFINFYTNAIFKNSRQSRGWAGPIDLQHTTDVLSSTSGLIV